MRVSGPLDRPEHQAIPDLVEGYGWDAQGNFQVSARSEPTDAVALGNYFLGDFFVESGQGGEDFGWHVVNIDQAAVVK